MTIGHEPGVRAESSPPVSCHPSPRVVDLVTALFCARPGGILFSFWSVEAGSISPHVCNVYTLSPGVGKPCQAHASDWVPCLSLSLSRERDGTLCFTSSRPRGSLTEVCIFLVHLITRNHSRRVSSLALSSNLSLLWTQKDCHLACLLMLPYWRWTLSLALFRPYSESIMQCFECGWLLLGGR